MKAICWALRFLILFPKQIRLMRTCSLSQMLLPRKAEGSLILGTVGQVHQDPRNISVPSSFRETNFCVEERE